MKPPLAILPQPYRHMLPPPIASTRGRGWSNVSADIYAVEDLAFVGMHREHLVSLQLTGCAHLYQERAGVEIVSAAGDCARCWNPDGEVGRCGDACCARATARDSVGIEGATARA